MQVHFLIVMHMIINAMNALVKYVETRYDNKSRSTRAVTNDTHHGHGIKCVGLIYASIYSHGQFEIMGTLIENMTKNIIVRIKLVCLYNCFVRHFSYLKIKHSNFSFHIPFQLSFIKVFRKR